MDRTKIPLNAATLNRLTQKFVNNFGVKKLMNTKEDKYTPFGAFYTRTKSCLISIDRKSSALMPPSPTTKAD